MAYKNPVPTLSSGTPVKNKNVNKQDAIENYPMRENVFFAFIDVLGFKQTFDDNSKDSEKRFAKDYEKVFMYYSQLLRNASFIQYGFSKAGQTSDSLYFYTDRIDYLAEFIKIYLHFSLYAMSNNVFFRGGIAKGCLFINEPHQFYGDCVIKAYLLEEKISKYPRIAFDQETYSELVDVLGIDEALKYDEKAGRFYLNPFVRIELSELASITNLDISQIQTFKKKDIEKNIKKGKKRFEFDERNYPKYQFLEKEIKEHGNIFE
ncbi:MAG: hypothetical protein Q3985_03660 [Eubacteriales bacterium]|nr:hypothetical protein [Eubacteriales bacterium]